MAIYKNSYPFGSIVRNGLVLNLDATNLSSYPGTGTTWFDTSGNRNSGSFVSGAYNDMVRGRSSVVFDGVDDYVTGSNSSNTVGSVNLWINPNTLVNASSSGSVLLTLRWTGVANSEWYVALGSITGLLTNEYITVLDVAVNQRTGVTDGGSLLANTWYNISINSESGLYQIYVNGAAKPVSTFGGGVTTLSDANKLTIGTLSRDVNGLFYNGKISTIQLYNRALTAAEVQQNFNALRNRFGI